MESNLFTTAESFSILIRTYAGLEEVLADEVRKLGGGDAQVITRGVECTGDAGFVYKLNLALHTGLRVLVPLKSFTFRDNKDFYNQVFDVNWPALFDVEKTMTIDTLLFSDRFRNSMFVSQLTKDAIADRFRKECGKRPFIDSREPHIYISVYVNGDRAILYLDSSGESLHKRGYRKEQVTAPLSEVMAASILRLSGWSHHFPLLDPMCGSGTFSIEAALLANRVPPGIFRSGFSFEHWKTFDPELFRHILDSLNNKITDHPLQIAASDKSRRAVELARQNAREAGVDTDIRFTVVPFEKWAAPEHKSFLFINPPYGERMRRDDLEALYSTIGTTLKHTFSGSEAWLFTSNADALKYIGLHPSRRLKLYNGPLECRLLRYELYSGSRKSVKKQ